MTSAAIIAKVKIGDLIYRRLTTATGTISEEITKPVLRFTGQTTVLIGQTAFVTATCEDFDGEMNSLSFPITLKVAGSLIPVEVVAGSLELQIESQVAATIHINVAQGENADDLGGMEVQFE